MPAYNLETLLRRRIPYPVTILIIHQVFEFASDWRLNSALQNCFEWIRIVTARRYLSSTTAEDGLDLLNASANDTVIQSPIPNGVERTTSTTEIRPFDSKHWEAEYFVASDAR